MEESGWKMVSGDVFRPPKNAILLCVQIGSGVQIITSAFATLFFAALGECLLSKSICDHNTASELYLLRIVQHYQHRSEAAYACQLAVVVQSIGLSVLGYLY